MRRAGAAIVLACLAAAAGGCGGGGGSDDVVAEDPFIAVEDRAAAEEAAARGRAAPRWETVDVLRGTGDATRSVRIDADAVQWRMRWRCVGTLALTGGEAATGRGCPSGSAPGRGRGAVRVRVTATRHWTVKVEQQVTDALREPLPAVLRERAARIVRRGTFRRIERRAAGRALIYRRPDGRHVLRLEGFSTAANSDLAVWLSRVRAPRSTREVLSDRHVRIASLKSTLGDQNYLLPTGVDLRVMRSVVIWCEPIRIAYTAAALTP